MLSSTGKAYTQRYCSAPTALSLPDQSAHRDPVPVLAKGPAEAIITLGKKKKKVLQVVCAVRLFRAGCKIHQRGSYVCFLLQFRNMMARAATVSQF